MHRHMTTSLTTVHCTRRSQIPLARENESTRNSGNADGDEPFLVVDNHHALDGVDDAAVPPLEDDFPKDNAFLDSGSEGEGEYDENDELDDADHHSVYDSQHKKLVVKVHGSKVPYVNGFTPFYSYTKLCDRRNGIC